jgi:hypothetical protein
VTVVTEVKKFRQRNTLKELVMHRPIHKVAVMKVNKTMKCLLRTMSPNGHRKMIPAAYPAWLQVGMREALSCEIGCE